MRSGHDTSTEPHYRVTWQAALGSLPSSARPLTHPQKVGLGIEAYYIYFTDHNRSIAADAREIGEAVAWSPRLRASNDRANAFLPKKS